MNLIKIFLVIILLTPSITNAETLNREDILKKDQILYDKGATAYHKGNYKSSIRYILESLTIREKILGKNHSLTATSYNNLGTLYETIGDYSKALSYYQKSLSVRKSIFGENHINTAKNYNNLGSLYQTLGKYKKAMDCHNKALDIRKKEYGDDHMETARSYGNIGFIHGRMGNYPESLKFYQKALNIRKKVLGEAHLDTAESYSDLSWAHKVMEDQNKAMLYAQKALSVREKILGKEHLDTAQSYSELGLLYEIKGNYLKAEKYYKKSLEIKEKILGKNHLITSDTYHRIGVFYHIIGKKTKALEYCKRALKIRKKILGKHNDTTAISYYRLGLIYQESKNYLEAAEYYSKALLIKEKILGVGHASTGVIYLNIGLLYQWFGDEANALKHFQKSLIIHKKSYGEKHSLTATSYSSLGNLYKDKKNYKKSMEYYKKALNIYTVIYDKEHAMSSSIYLLLSQLYQSQKNYYKSRHYAQLDFNIFIKKRDKIFIMLDSKQKENYLKENIYKIHQLLNTSTQYLSQIKKEKNTQGSKTIINSSINAWLNYKGSIFDSENAISILYASTKDKKLKEKIDDLVSSKRDLAKSYQSLPKPKEKEIWKKNINITEEKISKLTNEISSKATSFQEQQGLKSINYKDITSHLKDNELYIDYAKAVGYYYLFSLDHKENITFIQIDKNNTKKIDSLTKAFREDVNTILNDSNITDKKLQDLTVDSKTKLSKLYDLIIKKPLSKQLKTKNNLIISPDGALKLLPFETLYNKESDKYFIEEKEIRYIPSGKELVRLYKYSKDKVNKKQSAIIFANPNFNTKITSVSKEQIAITPNTNRSGIIKSLFRMHFSPLPGTKKEAKAIKAALKKYTISEYQKEKASESNLMKVKEPKILHIATHGFFINDNTIPNPMLKSGIALAGANTSAIKGKSDGIVTALKLSGLDLKGTDLVVLSACETGVVDINSTDSVSGLSKAFIQAGAKDIVMSLWSVDDQATKELMTSFYQEMKRNKNYAKALKAAKLKMIKEGRHPFYWGAFVVSGL